MHGGSLALGQPSIVAATGAWLVMAAMRHSVGRFALVVVVCRWAARTLMSVEAAAAVVFDAYIHTYIYTVPRVWCYVRKTRAARDSNHEHNRLPSASPSRVARRRQL